jgi:spermidine synthase
MSFEETQPWGKTTYSVLEGSAISFNTKRASINLITNPFFGRMLFIDGVLQSSTSDEEIYHKAITEHINPSGKILIAGGAEGACARELLKSSNPVLKVIMVDWDGELVQHMRQEPWHRGAFSDPRLSFTEMDIEIFLRKNELYNSIILDLLDPYTSEDVAWLTQITLKSILCLEKGGNLCMNAGSSVSIVNEIIEGIKKVICVSSISYRAINVPSFQETWYLIDICL